MVFCGEGITLLQCFCCACAGRSIFPDHLHSVSTHALLTSHVKFEHPCGSNCKVCHRPGRPVFNEKPGLVEPSARQLSARSSTVSSPGPTVILSGHLTSPARQTVPRVHAPIEPPGRILKRGSYLRLRGKCLSFLPAGSRPVCVQAVLSLTQTETQRQTCRPSCRALSVISVGQLCRRKKYFKSWLPGGPSFPHRSHLGTRPQKVDCSHSRHEHQQLRHTGQAAYQ